ncbi:MAG: 4-vinyl reductase [Pseudomonadota bacterium]
MAGRRERRALMRMDARFKADPQSGAVYDGDIRYMMIRPDALMGIFARLADDARADALNAFKASITEHGGRSAATNVAAAGPDKLLDVIEATAPALGWGIWRFERRDGPFSLIVENSPFAAGATFDGPACHPICGMAGAVASHIRGVRYTARETQCVASGAPYCRFEIEPDPL